MTPAIRSTPTPCSSSRRCPSRSPRRWWHTRWVPNAIGWDTPIVSKLPWFALSDPAVTKMVSVGDMFSHRSGLPDHAGDMLEDLGHDRRYVLDRLRDQPLEPFRISYAYTNFGLTPRPRRWPSARASPGRTSPPKRCFKPLGMSSTSYRFSDFEARTQPRARPHPHRRPLRAALHAGSRSPRPLRVASARR